MMLNASWITLQCAHALHALCDIIKFLPLLRRQCTFLCEQRFDSNGRYRPTSKDRKYTGFNYQTQNMQRSLTTEFVNRSQRNCIQKIFLPGIFLPLAFDLRERKFRNQSQKYLLIYRHLLKDCKVLKQITYATFSFFSSRRHKDFNELVSHNRGAIEDAITRSCEVLESKLKKNHASPWRAVKEIL